MRALLTVLVAACLAGSLQAQGSQYTPDQLDQMVAPIALYPDPLVALLLPASTAPNDIAAAAQFLASNGDLSQLDSQAWDPSVKGLAHYPDVLKWMNDNADWTQALGAAFAMQPADVMKSIQQMRAKAVAAGTLVDTPQQQVDDEGDDIRIVPTQQDTIYVPQYDPDDVYDVPAGDTGPFITFDAGYPVGPWLGFECDWDDFGIWLGPYHPGWAYRRDWRNADFGGRRWHPNPARGHALVRNFYRPGGAIPSPRVIAGARGPVNAGHPDQAFRGTGPARADRGSVTVTHAAPDYRGYEGVPRPATRAPTGPLYGGYDRGTRARDNSVRGHTSRQAPVKRAAPARSEPVRSSPAPGRDRH